MSERTVQETAAGGYVVPDVYGTSYEPTVNKDGAALLAAGRTSGGKAASHRSLLAFDLEDEGLLVPVKVLDSKLSLYVTAYTASPGVTSYIYRIRSGRVDWVETQATWNIYKTGSNWSTAMCDNSSTDMTTTNGQSFTSPTTSSAWLDIEGSDLDAQVQYALNNDVSPNRTCHFLLRVAAQGTSEANDTYWACSSSEGATESQHPKLWVKYRRKIIISDVQRWLRWFSLAPVIAPAAFLGFIINRRMVIERTQKKVLFHGTEKDWGKWRSGL